MRFLVALFAMFLMSGCFVASGSVRSGGMTYEASGLNAPSPMEMSAADLTSAQADRVRAEGRALEAHPELFMGWRGYGGGFYGANYYGYGQYSYGQTRDPALEERAEDLEGQATDFEQRLDALEGRQP